MKKTKAACLILCGLLISSIFMPYTVLDVHAEENQHWDFDYQGSVEEWEVPHTAKYKIEVWGGGRRL